MPATRNTNLSARADALRVGDRILLLGQPAEVISVLRFRNRHEVVVTVRDVDPDAPAEWTSRYPEHRMIAVAQFAPATDTEFGGL